MGLCGIEMQIREATNNDSCNISAIAQCVWIDTYATDGVRSAISKYVLTQFVESKIKEQISTKLVLVAEENSHLLGYVVFCHKEKELETLYVLPRFQRSGVGKKLLMRILSEEPSINLTCWEKNVSAIAFYKACGFIECGESFFELGGESHRNVMLTCT